MAGVDQADHVGDGLLLAEHAPLFLGGDEAIKEVIAGGCPMPCELVSEVGSDLHRGPPLGRVRSPSGMAASAMNA